MAARGGSPSPTQGPPSVPANFTGVIPPPGFTGVVPPLGFSGVVPGPNSGPWNGPNLSPLLVKEAVVNLRQAFAAQGGGGVQTFEEVKKEMEPEPASSEPDYYAVLELQKGANEEAIKKNYRRLVLLWHPDKHPTDREVADEKIRKINGAYETLGNPMKRDGYNQMLEAIERKKKNLRLDTSFIKPRMSIPKEFMLCPLGHPDKFVRAVGNELRVQSRDDARANFNDFFSKARFSIWWLPEVNNMCRIRTAESAGSGQEGGMMLNFLMEGAPTSGGQLCTKDAECVLRTNEDPRYSNVIAVASPFSPGAFRFEGAFWPGHYLSYRAPGKLCMAGLVDEVKDITDFYLVDFSAAYKTMTVDEALLGPVLTHGGGDYVKLSDLRADLSVRTFFQNMMKCPVWNNREFELFFEGHYEQWDFDKKRASVRPRSPAQQLAEKMRRSKSHGEVAQTLLDAGEELKALPVGAAEHILRRLLEGLLPPGLPVPAATAKQAAAVAAAVRRLVATMPEMCNHARDARAGEAPALSGVVALRKLVLELELPQLEASRPKEEEKEAKAGKTPDQAGSAEGASSPAEAPLAQLRDDAASALAGLASARLATAAEKLTAELAQELLGLPLSWQMCAEPLCEAVTPLLNEPRPPGGFLDLLRAAVRAGQGALPVAEAVARRELKALTLAQASTAAEILAAMVEGKVLLKEACAALRPPVLQRLPLTDLVRLVGQLGELRPTDENLRPALDTRIRPPIAALSLANVPAADLLRLAEASLKSPLIEDLALDALAGSVSLAIKAWPPEELIKFIQLMARSKAKITVGAQELYSQAAELLGPQLAQLPPQALLDTMALMGQLEKRPPLLEVLGKDLVARISDIDQASLLPLTESLLLLGAEHETVEKALDRWVQLLSSKEKGLPRADQVARLVQLLAAASPNSERVLQALAGHLERFVRHLTEAGRASLDAAFPGGEGPSFPGKEALLKALNPKRRSRSPRGAEKDGAKETEKAEEKRERRAERKGGDNDDRRENGRGERDRRGGAVDDRKARNDGRERDRDAARKEDPPRWEATEDAEEDAQDDRRPHGDRRRDGSRRRDVERRGGRSRDRGDRARGSRSRDRSREGRRSRSRRRPAR